MEKVLDGDCSKFIFVYLSPLDLLVCEKVCKLWKCMIEESWKNVTKLDYNTFNRDNQSISYDTLAAILDHCEDYVTEIDFSNWVGKTECIQAVADRCPGIEVLKLSQMEAEEDMVIYLSTKLKKLKILHLEKLNHVKETTYASLFAANPNLSIVYISKSNTLTGRCLTHLPKTIRELHLSLLNLLQTKYVVYCMGNAENMEKLRLNDCLGWIDECLESLGQAAPALKQLALNCTIMPLTAIDKFVNLQRLFLFYNNVNDDILKVISDGCINLEALGFGGSWFSKQKNISKIGLSNLHKLEKLVELNLKDLTCVDKDAIENVVRNGKLQILRLMDCERFDDAAVSFVLENCRNLTCFDINNCGITSEIAKMVVDYVREDKNRSNSLILKVSSRKFDIEDIRHNRHTFLQIYPSSDMQLQYFA